MTRVRASLQTTAPAREAHTSQFEPTFHETESGMVGRMGVLREETVAKNREFQRQIVRAVAV
jgi:hypothetical protein